MTEEAPQGLLRALGMERPCLQEPGEYLAWARYSEEMDAYWHARRETALLALERLPQSEVEGRSFAVAYLLVTEEERLWVRRFQLFMLLRHRAMEGLR